MLNWLFTPKPDTRPLWLVVVTFDIMWKDEVYVLGNTEGEARAAANRIARERHPFSFVVTNSVQCLDREEKAQ